MTKIRSGGGYTSNKLKESRSFKQEPKAHKVNVDTAAQLGMSVQFEKKPLQSVSGYQTKPQPSTGIPGTYNSKTSGPGSLRTTHRSGSQCLYGPVAHGQTNKAPDPPSTGSRGRDILSDYGREVTGKK